MDPKGTFGTLEYGMGNGEFISFHFSFINAFGLLTRDGNKKSLSWKPKPTLVEIRIPVLYIVS